MAWVDIASFDGHKPLVAEAFGGSCIETIPPTFPNEPSGGCDVASS